MTGEDFSDFIARQGWTAAEAVKNLGIGSHNTLRKYQKDGPPRLVELACYGIAGGGLWTYPPPFELVVEEHDYRFPLRGSNGLRFEGCRKCGCARDLIERENLTCMVPVILFQRKK